MKVAIIGASGFVGSAITQEALARGHQISALVSNPSRSTFAPKIQVQPVDVMDTAALTNALRGQETAISAFSGHAQPDVLDYYLRGFRSIVEATKRADVPRLLVVGGAGSLRVNGKDLVDTPSFPSQWKATADGARRALQILRQEPSLNWTMLSPSAHLEPGKQTGVFRIGADELLVGPNGQSEISLADYAKAMLDELEEPAHPRARFTVGY